MLGTGGWDIYVSGVNGFVGKDGVTKVCAMFCCQHFEL
jgi:hypothetical protein